MTDLYYCIWNECVNVVSIIYNFNFILSCITLQGKWCFCRKPLTQENDTEDVKIRWQCVDNLLVEAFKSIIITSTTCKIWYIEILKIKHYLWWNRYNCGCKLPEDKLYLINQRIWYNNILLNHLSKYRYSNCYMT